ncbi:hypothetical protein [Psychromicrobium xiongbiense]|uniref:hypothetical protein n=1 Tax=Psychromicrobium xiongbiense TaxID=3051184 RepID=UPI002556003C|nr:hypothetical protein [Psychromicrobium sp. YIM S02556]
MLTLPESQGTYFRKIMTWKFVPLGIVLGGPVAVSVSMANHRVGMVSVIGVAVGPVLYLLMNILFISFTLREEQKLQERLDACQRAAAPSAQFPAGAAGWSSAPERRLAAA